MPNLRRFAWMTPFGLVVGLAACAATPTPTPTEPPISARQTFGPWVASGCTVSAKTIDFLLSSQGYLNETGALELKLMMAPALTRPPFAVIAGLPIPVPIEGTGRHFTVLVPYTPEAVAAMLRDEPQLTVIYQKLGYTDLQEVAFPTKGLLEALGVIAGC